MNATPPCKRGTPPVFAAPQKDGRAAYAFVQFDSSDHATLPAVEVALSFIGVIAKESTNRHCAAAMTSALFNLITKTRPIGNESYDTEMREPPSAATARELHHVFAQYSKTSFPTLAKAMNAFRNI